MIDDPGRPEAPAYRCSARGCRQPARWALRWNNPKLHDPQRRKTWLACDEHRDSLSAFLGARGFLREVTELDGIELDGWDTPDLPPDRPEGTGSPNLE